MYIYSYIYNVLIFFMNHTIYKSMVNITKGKMAPFPGRVLIRERQPIKL